MPVAIDAASAVMAGVESRFSGLDKFETLTGGSLAADIRASVERGDIERGASADEIRDIMAGWSVQLDKDGLARLVNRSNLLRARRW